MLEVLICLLRDSYCLVLFQFFLLLKEELVALLPLDECGLESSAERFDSLLQFLVCLNQLNKLDVLLIDVSEIGRSR